MDKYTLFEAFICMISLICCYFSIHMLFYWLNKQLDRRQTIIMPFVVVKEGKRLEREEVYIISSNSDSIVRVLGDI